MQLKNNIQDKIKPDEQFIRFFYFFILKIKA